MKRPDDGVVSGTPVAEQDTTTGRSPPCLCLSCRGRLLGREHADEDGDDDDEQEEDKDEDKTEDRGKDEAAKESWEVVQAAVAAVLVRALRSVGSALILKLPA